MWTWRPGGRHERWLRRSARRLHGHGCACCACLATPLRLNPVEKVVAAVAVASDPDAVNLGIDSEPDPRVSAIRTRASIGDQAMSCVCPGQDTCEHCRKLGISGRIYQKVPPAGIEPATHGLGNRCSI